MSRPLLWHLELVIRHIQLQCLCGTITVVQLKASLNVLKSLRPTALQVKLECLSEYRIELLDVLLHTHDVAV